MSCMPPLFIFYLLHAYFKTKKQQEKQQQFRQHLLYQLCQPKTRAKRMTTTAAERAKQCVPAPGVGGRNNSNRRLAFLQRRPLL